MLSWGFAWPTCHGPRGYLLGEATRRVTGCRQCTASAIGAAHLGVRQDWPVLAHVAKGGRGFSAASPKRATQKLWILKVGLRQFHCREQKQQPPRATLQCVLRHQRPQQTACARWKASSCCARAGRSSQSQDNRCPRRQPGFSASTAQARRPHPLNKCWLQ